MLCPIFGGKAIHRQRKRLTARDAFLEQNELAAMGHREKAGTKALVVDTLDCIHSLGKGPLHSGVAIQRLISPGVAITAVLTHVIHQRTVVRTGVQHEAAHGRVIVGIVARIKQKVLAVY